MLILYLQLEYCRNRYPSDIAFVLVGGKVNMGSIQLRIHFLNKTKDYLTEYNAYHVSIT